MTSSTPPVLALPGASTDLTSRLQAGLEQVEALIVERTRSEDDFITEANLHLAKTGGKRFRPMLTMLVAELGENAQAMTAADAATFGEWVVVTVPLKAIDDLPGAELAGKIVVDITNPLDFSTFDALVVPVGSSAAAGLQERLPEAKVLFSGDTLFAGGPGATGRSFSDFDTIIDSIRTSLLTLPGETEVYTGHGDATSIGAEAPHLEEWIRRGE